MVWRSWRMILGLSLILLGLLFLAQQLTGWDVWRFFWPVLIIASGLLFFVVMVWAGPMAGWLALPGAIVTTVGLILLIQNTFDMYQTWTYAWALLIAANGVGIWIQGRWSGNPGLLRAGRRTLVTGLVLFVVAGAFFELVLNLSGFASNDAVRVAGPALIILLGLYLLLRSSLPRRSEY
jgi:hypothetical protein